MAMGVSLQKPYDVGPARKPEGRHPGFIHQTLARFHRGDLQAGGSTWLLARLPRERPSNPRQSGLYGIGGSSALGDNGADAIVKSSTNLQNSLSLSSRMLAYAATMRNARTRA
jgi:hypothetical protein